MKLISLRLALLFGVSANLFAAGTAAANDARAKSLYKVCAPCHGDQAEGNEVLAAPAIAGMPEWYINNQLDKFRSGVRGKHPKDLAGMRMRPLSRTLNTEEDVRMVAGYVAGLKKVDVKRTIHGNVVKGETAFAVCSSCHGADGAGNKDLNAPPLRGLNDWYLLTQLKNFKAKIRAGDPAVDPIGAGMAPMAAMLDEEGMKDIVTYINALK